MGDMLEKLNSIKEHAMLGHNGDVIDELNALITSIETVPDMEISPAQEDIIPMEPGGNILITGENAHVRIYMAPQGENGRL